MILDLFFLYPFLNKHKERPSCDATWEGPRTPHPQHASLVTAFYEAPSKFLACCTPAARLLGRNSLGRLYRIIRYRMMFSLSALRALSFSYAPCKLKSGNNEILMGPVAARTRAIIQRGGQKAPGGGEIKAGGAPDAPLK
ncbi:unnamed protein product, partial [Iphiclides podalirius]